LATDRASSAPRPATVARTGQGACQTVHERTSREHTNHRKDEIATTRSPSRRPASKPTCSRSV